MRGTWWGRAGAGMLLSAATVLLATSSAVAADALLDVKITAPDATVDAAFGQSVSAWGDRIVVGAPFAQNDRGVWTGAAYVLEPDGAGGFARTRLLAADGADADVFGLAVSVWKDTIVVGAPYDGGRNAGAAYVFSPDGHGGYAQIKLTAPDAPRGAYFGWAVAAWGDTIVVGAPSDPRGGDDPGAAYLFAGDGSGGYTAAKLTAADPMAGAQFGSAVAVAGDTVVVGARYDAERGVNAGAAYVFAFDHLSRQTQTKITASDAVRGDVFGWSVAVWDDMIAVGSYGDDVADEATGPAAGSVHVFTPDGAGGYTDTRLVASDAAGDAYFGRSVAVSGGTLLVGAPYDDEADTDSGSAYLFTPDGTGGFAETKLAVSDGHRGQRLGDAVGLYGGTAVVAAPGDNEAAIRGGAVYSGSAATRDTDGDGVPDHADDCPSDADPDQADRDGDAVGDVCDSHPDAGRLAVLHLTSSASTAAEGGTVTLEVAGADARGNPVALAAEDVTVTSNVRTDVVEGLTVHFPSASEHVLTATVGMVSASVSVEVTGGTAPPRPSPTPTPTEGAGELAASGGGFPPGPTGAGLLLLTVGTALVVWAARRARRA